MTESVPGYSKPIQATRNEEREDVDLDEMVMIVPELPAQAVSLKSSSSLEADREKIFFLTPDTLKNFILNSMIKAKVVPNLVIIGGLPNSKKTAAINMLLDEKIKTMDRVAGKRFDERSVSLFVAIANSETITNEIFFTKLRDTDGYSRIIQSVIEFIIRTRGEVLLTGDSRILLRNFNSFSNDILSNQFATVFSNLCNFNSSSQRRAYMEWNKHLTNGLGLINIWDMGFSKVATYVVPVIAGYLTNSFVWMFLDLMRDVNNLYDPPELPSTPFNDQQLIMKWRARIHYLLRIAKLASSLDGSDSNRSNACHIVASVTSSDVTENDIVSKIKQLKDKIVFAAKKMKINHLINTDDITVFRESEKNVKELEELFMKILKQQMKNITCDVPLSFIFLRSAFYDVNLVYTSKSKLQEAANELEMSDDVFAEFCRVFTSFGSIIDVSMIDKSSDLIILKPVRFINNLEKLFYCSSADIDPVVSQYGVVTLSNAEKIFGSDDALVYLNFLESIKLAIKFPPERFNLPTIDAYYIPNACNSPPIIECSHTSIQLIHNIYKPMSNMMVLFTKQFLESYPNNRLEILSTEPHINVTNFRVFLPSAPNGITFKFVCMGDAIEFRLPDDNTNEEICQQIITVCRSVFAILQLVEKVKYNFAIICSSDDASTTFELLRKHHHFPLKNFCPKCLSSNTPAIKTWNEVLQQDEFKIPEGQILNGDPLLKDEFITVCDMMTKLTNEGADALVHSLFPDKECATTTKSTWREFMKMMLAWEETPDPNDDSCKIRSKKDLSEIMNKLSYNDQLTDNDKRLLRDTAINLQY